MLDIHNPIAQIFRMARDRLSTSNTKNLCIKLIGTRSIQNKQYDRPTVSEIAGLIVGDFGQGDEKRDIIIQHKTEGL